MKIVVITFFFFKKKNYTIVITFKYVLLSGDRGITIFYIVNPPILFSIEE